MQDNWDRKVIPRWRSAKVSSSLPESLPSKPSRPSASQELTTAAISSEITKRVEAWKAHKDLGGAVDLLNYGHSHALQPLLIEPAKYILSLPSSEIPPELSRLAANLLGSEQVPSSSGEALDFTERKYQEISRLKSLLLINPRDPISLVDLARLYTILGQGHKARSAITVASALAPNHRFVLRSSSRFFIHDGDPERALFILNRSDRTKLDPWLLASQISVETLTGRTPRHLKRGRQLLDSRSVGPSHTAELGAAIATVLLNDGSAKEAKRTFNKALIEPNENAVAQAIWASNNFKLPIYVQHEWMSGRFSFEANFYKFQAESNFEDALECAGKWFDDEPFSTRPLRGAAFSCSVLGRHAEAEKHTRRALLNDSNELADMNNLVFSLASQNKLPEASSLLNKIIEREMRSEDGVSGHTLANIGLISYRLAALEDGRFYYEKALEVFRKNGQQSSLALAHAFWAHEAMSADDNKINTILNGAENTLKKYPAPGAATVLAQVQTSLGGRAPLPEPKGNFHNADSWTHDAERNILIIKSKAPFKVDKK